MASSLRLITYNLVTRTFGHPVVASSSRFLSTDAASKDESGLRSISPIISQITFSSYFSDDIKSFELHMHGLDRNEHQHVDLETEHKALPKQGNTNRYLIRPTKMMRSDIKDEMKEGMVTFPNKDHLMANIGASIIASFIDISAKNSWCYYDMFFDRSILGRELCPIIAKPSLINSFTMRKIEDDDSLRICMDIPGIRKMKLTTHGLTLSVGMKDVKRACVKTYFNYGTFFIEGKSKRHHYITGVHLPEGIHKKHNMIKRQMKDGVFYANIPCCVKKEKLREIKDQLDPAKSLNSRTNF